MSREKLAPLPVVWLDTEDDGDPYYAWQEEMTHRAKAERITYGQWIRRELDRLDRIGSGYDEYNVALKRREHAGVAASRLAEIVADVLNPSPGGSAVVGR